MKYRGIACLAVLTSALAGPAPRAAAADPWSAYRKVDRVIARREAAYFKALPRRLAPAMDHWLRVRRRWATREASDIAGAHTEVQAVYDELEQLETQRCEALEAFAELGAAGAGPHLLEVLLDTAGKAEAADQAVLAAKPIYLGFTSQAATFRRAALAHRERTLVRLFAGLSGAGRLLASEGLAQATHRDRRKSVAHRVAVLDTWAAAGSHAGWVLLGPHLRSSEPAVRIATLEALARVRGTRDALRPLLQDEHAVVRRALLQSLTQHKAAVAWVPDLVARLAVVTGQERAEVFAALRATSGHALPADAALWEGWLAKHREDVDAGRRPAVASEPTVGAGPTIEGAAFYGIPTHSLGVMFLLDWTVVMTVPADHDVERTRTAHEWHTGDRNWYDHHEMHRHVVARELDATLAELPREARFGVALMAGNLLKAQGDIRGDLVLGQRGLIAPDAAGRKRAAALVATQHPGWALQHPDFSGYLVGLRLGGVDPARTYRHDQPTIDTICLVGGGDQKGGRFVLPQHELDTFARINRWHRVVVHIAHISYDMEPRRTRLAGYAARSGGTYRRVTSIPVR